LLLSYKLISYRNFSGVGLKPDAFYQLEIPTPVSGFVEPTDPAQLKNSLLEEVVFTKYDGNGNVLDLNSKEGVKKSYIWNAAGNQVLAEVLNASSAQIFHTSFEENGNISGDSKTGEKSYSGSYTVTKPAAEGEYVLPIGLRRMGFGHIRRRRFLQINP
jgi:hypothetical protein